MKGTRNGASTDAQLSSNVVPGPPCVAQTSYLKWIDIYTRLESHDRERFFANRKQPSETLRRYPRSIV
jgi:hypothetical protein